MIHRISVCPVHTEDALGVAFFSSQPSVIILQIMSGYKLTGATAAKVVSRLIAGTATCLAVCKWKDA
jgi:hypothetical protein